VAKSATALCGCDGRSEATEYKLCFVYPIGEAKAKAKAKAKAQGPRPKAQGGA
jgi:hypothetical protein